MLLACNEKSYYWLFIALQGVFIMSISTVIGSVMALFICLNVINECKVINKKLKQDVINN